MPVIMRGQRLDKTPPFTRGLLPPIQQQPGRLEHPIDAAGTHRHDVPVQHHERQTPIPFQRILPVAVDDLLFLPLFQPVVARHPGVVLVDFAITLFPVMKLALGDAEPAAKAAVRDFRLLGPDANEVDNLVAAVGGDPDAGQGSPRLFFSWTCSSINSAMTESRRCSLASSCSILWSLAFSTDLLLRSLSKARWPFSKKSLSQP